MRDFSDKNVNCLGHLFKNSRKTRFSREVASARRILASETSSKGTKRAYSREERRAAASHVGDTWYNPERSE